MLIFFSSCYFELMHHKRLMESSKRPSFFLDRPFSMIQLCSVEVSFFWKIQENSWCLIANQLFCSTYATYINNTFFFQVLPRSLVLFLSCSSEFISIFVALKHAQHKQYRHLLRKLHSLVSSSYTSFSVACFIFALQLNGISYQERGSYVIQLSSFCPYIFQTLIFNVCKS